MKKVYTLAAFLITGVSNNFGQNKIDIHTELNTGIQIMQDAGKKILNVYYSSTERSDLAIKIKNTEGKVLYSEKLPDEKFEHMRTINMTKYGKGSFIVEVDTEKGQDVERVEVD